MTTVLLIRHATCDPVGRQLAGRASGVSLNASGRGQAVRLAAWLAPLSLAAVYASPLARARETAAYLAEPRRLGVVEHEGFTEIEFGAWTGRELESLDGDAHWQRFNGFRSLTRPPGGELMLEAQTRAIRALGDLAARHADERIAVVSHADVLRAAVAFFAGAPLDLFSRLEISPASVTTLELHEWGARLRAINATPDPLGD